MITTEEFLSIIKEKLKTKTPFTFVRYSDGEIMLLNRDEYYNDYIAAIKKLWGYEPEEKDLEYLSLCLVHTLSHSDVIGFPTERHLAREDYFGQATKVFINKVSKNVLDHTITASVDVAYELLYQNKYEELLRDIDTLCYVSCRNLDNELKEKYNIKNIHSYIIAPEPKFTSGYVGERHFPDQFDKIQEWIRVIDCKGHLCLVGGGAPSKIYNLWFKEQGGIALDIGAVFDLWAGKRTRGAGRGIDVVDNTYKI